MPADDLYQDQIMIDHLSRTWTNRFLDGLESDLGASGWQAQSKSKITLKMQHKNSGRSLIAHTMHDLPKDLDSDCIIVTDVVVKDYENKIFNLGPEVFGEFYHDFKYNNTMPSTKFNCFINRGCPFRQSWFYQLHRRKLLNQGHVSYWCHDRFDNRTPKDFFEFLFERNNQIFEKEHHELRSQIPFKNFELSLEDAIIDSKVTVVIETFFDNDRNVSFSEKIWRSLQLPRPWMLFGAAHSVDHLRNWGFDVLDDYVDHSYDSLKDPVARQIQILDQLDHDRVLSPEDLEDLEQRAQYNKRLLKEFKQNWPKKYKTIVEEINRISNNESLTLRA